jgi:hypothetical protein
MITTERHGRNLHIFVEGVDDPYVIRPLPGNAGVQVTDTYLGSAAGVDNTAELLLALVMCVDGAVEDPETGRWVPLPEDQWTNYNRLGRELRQTEAEAVLMPAFFWQSILGDDGVKLYVEGGEGLPGTLKATGAMAARQRLLTSRTSPLSALGNQTQTGRSQTGTSSRRGGGRRGGKRKKR